MVGLQWRETPRDRAPLGRFQHLVGHQFRALRTFQTVSKIEISGSFRYWLLSY